MGLLQLQSTLVSLLVSENSTGGEPSEIFRGSLTWRDAFGAAHTLSWREVCERDLRNARNDWSIKVSHAWEDYPNEYCDSVSLPCDLSYLEKYVEEFLVYHQVPIEDLVS